MSDEASNILVCMGKAQGNGREGHLVCFNKVKHTRSQSVIRLTEEGSFVGIKLTGVTSCRLYGRKGNVPKGEVKSSPGRRKL